MFIFVIKMFFLFSHNEEVAENVPTEEQPASSSSGADWGWGLGSWIDTAKKTVSENLFFRIKFVDLKKPVQFL